MKKLLTLLSIFAFGTMLLSCGDDPKLEAGCDSTEAEIVETCDISAATVCSDENTEEVYYSYNDKKYYDVNELIGVLCPKVSIRQQQIIKDRLTARGKALICRLRANAI